LASDLKKSTRGVLCLQHTLHKSEVNFFFEWLQGEALAVLLRGGSCLICSYLVFFFVRWRTISWYKTLYTAHLK
jgi:hypothetical protein